MQIRMKMTTRDKQLFLNDFRKRLSDRGWSMSELARRTRINQGQISRIAAGKFKTFGSNVMKICIELEMKPGSYYLPTKGDEDRNAIIDSAIAIWDGTHGDTATVVSLLRQIAELRKRSGRS
jgi:DNA-binding Xre family transcriptional regulator